MRQLTGKTVLITGGTRGIGREIAVRCAQEGAQVAVVSRHGEDSAVTDEVRALGGRCIAVNCDIRDERQVEVAIAWTVSELGGLDVVVNNAAMLVLKGTAEISSEEYDAMVGVNTRGAFLVAKYALPHLQRSNNGHVLTLCPKPQLDERWFGANLAYTASKFGAGLLAFGLAVEQRPHRVASNALWPFTTIDTDGLAECGRAELQARPRTAAILADAALWIITQNSSHFSGHFCIDEIVLREAGVTDFERYSAVPGTPQSALSRDHMVAPEQLARVEELRRRQ